MFLFSHKTKFPAFLFIAASLAAFILTPFLYFTLKSSVASSSKNYELSQYFFNTGFKQNDPLVTNMPDLKDMLRGPIIGSSDPILGKRGAKVALVEYSDYTCEFCKKQELALKKIATLYGDKIKIVWKDYPGGKPNSDSYKAAIAARCAGEQGNFWQYHDLLFANAGNLNTDKFIELANSLNLNETKFKDCLIDKNILNIIKDNVAEANALQITGVPYIFVNDKEVMGEITFTELKQMIDLELNK